MPELLEALAAAAGGKQAAQPHAAGGPASVGMALEAARSVQAAHGAAVATAQASSAVLHQRVRHGAGSHALRRGELEDAGVLGMPEAREAAPSVVSELGVEQVIQSTHGGLAWPRAQAQAAQADGAAVLQFLRTGHDPLADQAADPDADPFGDDLLSMQMQMQARRKRQDEMAFEPVDDAALAAAAGSAAADSRRIGRTGDVVADGREIVAFLRANVFTMLVGQEAGGREWPATAALVHEDLVAEFERDAAAFEAAVAGGDGEQQRRALGRLQQMLGHFQSR
ncbi:hypothetical protein HK105_202554 [Polyrhizophydium stewartii]|uniref:Uncharacterized protein n=1 Tax=Polyrhizophydium stewartii TaxID=2732419 RepID=A0ABR4NDT4_9FUNG